jgi:hypothetical protein
MAKFPDVSPKAEMRGFVVMPFLTASNKDEIRPLVEKHGFAEVDPEAWYPIRNAVALLRDIEEEYGDGMMDFVSIGMQVAEHAAFPPEYDDMSYIEIMKDWNRAYGMNNRGEGFGAILYEEVDDKHIKMVHTTPFPDDYAYGAMYGAAKRFLPEGTHFVVRYDDDEPRRDEGGEKTIIHIEWS